MRSVTIVRRLLLLIPLWVPAVWAQAVGTRVAMPPLAVPADSADVIARARAIVRGIMTRHLASHRADGTAVDLPNSIPGMTVAVVVRGRMLWTDGFGVADIEQGVPATPQTRYRIGSLSKLITAAALSRMVDSGRMQLDVAIQTYVPAFPVKSAPITVRQLAGHLSGIRHYRYPGDPTGTHAYASLAEGLEIFANDSLLFAPGSRYGYSSYGYNLLGVAIEAAAGRSYASAVRSLVLEPLGMWSTSLDYRDSIVPGRAAPYDYGRDQRVVNARYDDVSYKWPSGGFVSTAPDMANFAAAQLGPGFLSARTLATVFTSQRTTDGKATGTGIGWRIGTDSAGRVFYHHGGAATGGRAFLIAYPREQVVVVMLANIQAVFDERDASRIAELFMR